MDVCLEPAPTWLRSPAALAFEWRSPSFPFKQARPPLSPVHRRLFCRDVPDHDRITRSGSGTSSPATSYPFWRCDQSLQKSGR
jgi:hypothetical protein